MFKAFPRSVFKKILQAAGYAVYRHPHLPKGADAFASIRSHWPDWQPSVIFDVGANIGQTVRRLRPPFPRAHIYSFEPGSLAHTELLRLVPTDAFLHVYKTALGASPGTALLHLNPASDQNSLLVPAPGSAAPANATSVLAPASPDLSRSETVTVDTLDAFCAREKVTRIDLLKIDVEGAELSVLDGANRLLATHAIDYLVIEAGLRPDNPRFTPLHELIARLAAHDFWLIGIYEQYGVTYSQAADFCNALFARRPLLEAAERRPSPAAPSSAPAA